MPICQHILRFSRKRSNRTCKIPNHLRFFVRFVRFFLFFSFAKPPSGGKLAKYSGCYSQIPQLFPQVSSPIHPRKICRMQSYADKSKHFRLSASIHLYIFLNIHSPPQKFAFSKSKMQERICVPAFFSKCFSQNGLGGIGIQAHIGNIPRQILIIRLGTDHGTIVTAQI